MVSVEPVVTNERGGQLNNLQGDHFPSWWPDIKIADAMVETEVGTVTTAAAGEGGRRVSTDADTEGAQWSTTFVLRGYRGGSIEIEAVVLPGAGGTIGAGEQADVSIHAVAAQPGAGALPVLTFDGADRVGTIEAVDETSALNGVVSTLQRIFSPATGLQEGSIVAVGLQIVQNGAGAFDSDFLSLQAGPHFQDQTLSQ